MSERRELFFSMELPAAGGRVVVEASEIAGYIIGDFVEPCVDMQDEDECVIRSVFMTRKEFEELPEFKGW